MSRSTRSLSSLRYWQWLLSAERALTSIISYLLPPEAVCLLVYALEAEYEPLVRFLYAHSHLLSFGDASRRFTNILHCAAAYGLAQVVQRFLRLQLNYRLCLNVKTTGTNDVLTMKHTLLNGKIFAWCLRNSTYTFPAKVMYEASRQGNQEVIQWLDHCCQYTTYKAMEYAASSGHLDIVMWFYEKTLKQNTEQLVYMVQSLEDKLQVLNWVTVFPTERYFREGFASRDGLLAAIYDQRDPLLPWTNGTALDLLFTRKRYRALDTAAAKGNFTMVTKLHQDGRWPCTSLAMDMAAANGHLEIVKFLHHNRREGGTAVGMCSAAGNGHLQVVQWLYQNRSSDGCRPIMLDLAATNGHVDVLRWLAPRFTQFSCSPAFLPSVAAQGNIKTLQYLHKEMRMPLDQRTLEAAIGSGHFELVTYIFDRVPTEVKHTLSITAAEKAAASGNLELLAFVVERLGVWSPQVLIAAALTGNVEMAKWIVKRMDSPSAEPEEVVLVRERRYRAATSITMDTIVLDPSSALLKRRVSYNNITSAEFVRPLDIVDGSTLYRCASLRHFDMIEWILRHRLFSPSFSLSMKEGEIVLRAVVGRGMTDDDALDADKACNGDTNAATTESATVAAIATVNRNEMGVGGNGGVHCIASAGSTSDGKRSQFEPFAWACPAKTNSYWQTKFVHLVIQYYPESSLELEWMPLWAAQRGDLFVLKQLHSVKHPQLFTQQTFAAIMRYTKAGDSLQWFQAHSPTLMGDSSIVEWGVKYRQFAYLTYVFLHLQPVRSDEWFRQHGVEYALHVACAMGHLDVVTWICGNCEIFMKVPAVELHAKKLGRLTIWKDALLAAARCGQTDNLAWLHEKFTFFCNVPESARKMAVVRSMADAAAEYGQLRVLRWLQATVAHQMVEESATADDSLATDVETSFVSTSGLLEAMVNCHVDVVQWVCAVDVALVSQQTPERRSELATFLREETDGFVPSKLGFVFPPL